jgi:hypothetical protein
MYGFDRRNHPPAISRGGVDPETAASVRHIYDRTSSPKLGGVRFVDPDRQTHADRILKDTRSAEQIASDGFEQLLKPGADANPDFLLGTGAPVLRLTATKGAFERGVGLVRSEGEAAPVSVSTAWRLHCEGALGGITFSENGETLDFGRESRYFSRRQKEALAIKWGGCACPGVRSSAKPGQLQGPTHRLLEAGWRQDQHPRRDFALQASPPVIPQQRLGDRARRQGTVLADSAGRAGCSQDAHRDAVEERREARASTGVPTGTKRAGPGRGGGGARGAGPGFRAETPRSRSSR